MTLHGISKLRILSKASDAQIRLRICPDMKKLIEKQAKDSGRSFNNHILYLIRLGLIKDYLDNGKDSTYEKN